MDNDSYDERRGMDRNHDNPTIGLEDFKAIRDSMSRIGKEVRLTRSEFDTHLKMNDLILGNVNKNIEDILKAIHEQGEKFNEQSITQRDHIEHKIDECHNEMVTNFVTKDQMIIVRDEAVADSKENRRLELKVAITDSKTELVKTAKSHLSIVWGALVIGTIMGLFILSGYNTDFKALQRQVLDHDKMYQRHLVKENKNTTNTHGR